MAPRNSGFDFFNYKTFHSNVLMAMSHAYYTFINIDEGGRTGRLSNSGFFENAEFTKL